MVEQLKYAFGLDVQIDQTAKPSGLPFYMTNNRKWLITEAPHWKEIRMTACAEGKEFYDAGEPYLIDPVQKRIFSTLKYGNIIRHFLPKIKLLIRFRWQFLWRIALMKESRVSWRSLWRHINGKYDVFRLSVRNRGCSWYRTFISCELICWEIDQAFSEPKKCEKMTILSAENSLPVRIYLLIQTDL